MRISSPFYLHPSLAPSHSYTCQLHCHSILYTHHQLQIPPIPPSSHIHLFLTLDHLSTLLGEPVCVITNDGRIITGVLRGFDKSNINLILSEAAERMFSVDAAVENVELGLFLLRGDNLAAVGVLDKEKDEKTVNSIRTGQIKPVTH